MTVSMLILIILHRPISFQDRFELQEVSRIASIRSVSGLILATILVTVFLEFLGGLALFTRAEGLVVGAVLLAITGSRLWRERRGGLVG